MTLRSYRWVFRSARSDTVATVRVATVIVTRDRSRILHTTLEAVRQQTRAPDAVFVVDNASNDDTPEMLRRDHPGVVHLRQTENHGSGPGLGVGMRAANGAGFEAFWLLDDDSEPSPEALETLLATWTQASTPCGIIGLHGGVVHLGRITHLTGAALRRRPQPVPGAYRVDFVLLDGALVHRSVVDAVGYPRADFFMMMGDVEYPSRAARAGFDVLVVARPLIDRHHLGSVGSPPPWRGYYQTRNHLRWALDRRSPILVAGWAARQLSFAWAARHTPDRRARLRLRLRGARDGLRGRMGRTVEPQ